MILEKSSQNINHLNFNLYVCAKHLREKKEYGTLEEDRKVLYVC